MPEVRPASPAPASPHAAPKSADGIDTDAAARAGVQITRDDGLYGRHGLYAVTTGGVTRYMTLADANDLVRALAPTEEDDEPAQPPPSRLPQSLSLLDSSTLCRGPCFTDQQIDDLARRTDPVDGPADAGRGAPNAAAGARGPAPSAAATSPAADRPQRSLGQVGGLTVLVAAHTAVPPAKPPVATPPAATRGPVVVTGSPDAVVVASASDMVARNGHGSTGLWKGALAGTDEVTLVAHGTPKHMDLGPAQTPTAPKQLARQLVEAGWEGGTLRLASCNTGANGGRAYAQQLANELAALGKETVVLAPSMRVAVVSGLPRVESPVPHPVTGGPAAQPKGQGWEAFAPEPASLSWKATGVGIAKTGAAIGLSILHSHAVAERTRQEVQQKGWSDPGPTGSRLYDFGAWLLDPTNEAGRAIPFSQRFEMSTWRRTMKEAADAKAPGDHYVCKWTTSDGRDDFGTPKYRSFTATYLKHADGRWSTVSCKGCEGDEVPPDLNRIIDPKQSDEDIRQYLQLPAPWSDLA